MMASRTGITVSIRGITESIIEIMDHSIRVSALVSIGITSSIT